MSPDDFYGCTRVLFALGGLVSSLEYLTNWRGFFEGGLFSTRLSLRLGVGKGHVHPLVQALWHPASALAVLVLRGIVSALLLIPRASEVETVLLGLMMVFSIYLSHTLPLSSDGSDKMHLVLATGLLAHRLCAGSYFSCAGLVYIAAQSCLSYLAPGLEKLSSPEWRSGEIMVPILDSQAYGTPRAAGWRKSMGLCKALAWGTIGFEVLFCLVLVAPPGLRAGLLLTGIAFHAGIVYVMGFNTFLINWAATYPALWFVATLLHGS